MGEVIAFRQMPKKTARSSFQPASGRMDAFTPEEKVALAKIFQSGEAAGLFCAQQIEATDNGFLCTFYGINKQGIKTPMARMLKEAYHHKENSCAYRTESPLFDANKDFEALKRSLSYTFALAENKLCAALAEKFDTPGNVETLRPRDP